MEYTGERLIPGRKGLELLELEHRARYELVVPYARGKKVLDLGCGTGYGANRLAEVARRVVGVDVSAEAVDYARGAFARSNLALAVGDVSRDELVEELQREAPEPFDVVVCFEVLEHVPEPALVLARIKRLLHPSGLLFVSTPNIARPQAAVERDNPFHLVEYSEEELSGVLRDKFASIRLFRQNVHVGTGIVPADGGRVRRVTWRDAGAAEAKYFVAVCSDDTLEASLSGVVLSTGDAHLTLLQERLGELRKDQQQRRQMIEQLRARLKAQEQNEEKSREVLELLHRQELMIAGVAQGQVDAVEKVLGTVIGLAGGGAQEDGREADGPVSQRLVSLLNAQREERDAAIVRAAGLERERDELIGRLAAAEAGRADLERQVGERELQLAAGTERLQELQRQVEERTSVGLDLAREIERLRQLLASSQAELEAERSRLAERHRVLEEQLASGPSPLADPLFLRHFADLSAQAEERLSRLLGHNSELKEQNRRLIEELGARGQVDGDPPLHRSGGGPGASRELETWKRLAYDLAAELYHVLTSRRWRFAMFLVRLRNFVLRFPEGDPIGAHLNHHLRRAGQEPASFDLPRARARRLRRSPLSRPAAGPGGAMRLLSEAEKKARVEALATREQDVLVSIVMPTWNREGQIADAIDSVKRQSYRNWELLVVDDGSTDATALVVERVGAGDERIRYLAIPHSGVSAARDTGLEAAGGELVAYLDSDNTWDPDFLLLMANAVRDSGQMCAYAALRVIDHDQARTISLRARRFDYPTLLKNNYIDINVFVHRIELFRELGGFDRELRRWVDWDLVLRYVKRHPPEEVPVVLCDYTRDKRCHQITLEEPSSYKLKVLNKHLIDWEAQRRDLQYRKAGLVSVVIPNYDLPELTARSVESILAAGGPNLEVVVVDNGSSPRNRSKLRARLKGLADVILLENYENFGFSLGCNLGAAAARGEFVVWLNNDTEVTPGWVEPLIRPLREDPTIGMVAAKLLWPDGTLQHGGMVFGPRSKIPYHIYQGFPGDHPAVNKRRRFRLLNGACLAVRAEDVVALEGFDPLYLNGCEDVDFCLRMHTLLGKEGLYEPASVVVHHEGRSPGRSKNIQFNRALLVSKWGDRIAADDHLYYEEDGFVVKQYVKKGAERDGESALYHPKLAPKPAGSGRGSGDDPERLLRVGFVSIWYERGVSYVTRQLALALEQGGRFESHVLARWESQRFHNAGSIFHSRVVDGGDDPTPPETVAWARERQLDIVVFVEIHPNDWKRVEALKAAGFRVLCYEHFDILRLDMLDRYEQVDGFLANSFFGWRTWKREFPDKPVLALPWGIPSEVVGRGLVRQPAREMRFVHVAGWGGLNDRKNTSFCIEAFHEAAPPAARLVVYSQSPLDRYGKRCAEIVASDAAIEVHVGNHDDIWSVYQNADVLLWPSKREGLGLPILEALASGVPVLISDGWLMKEWPVLGEHAVVCRARDGAAEQEAVARFLPLIQVDRGDLVRKIQSLASSPEDLAAMTAAVRRDRACWLWSWQPLSLGIEMRRFIVEGGFHPDPAAYIPTFVLELERRRARSRGEEAGAVRETIAAASSPPVRVKPFRTGSDAEFLFIAGCQRSGTTALVQLLNQDERFVIGRERFKYCRSEITPEHFREEHFFSPQERETNYRVEKFYEPLRSRWRAGGVRYIGDKVPFYYKDLFYLAETFPDCKILFLIRDLEGVAASHNARAANPKDKVWKPRRRRGVAGWLGLGPETETVDYRRAAHDWTESLVRFDEFVSAGHEDQIFPVHYERFFAGEQSYLDALYDFLELPVTPKARRAFLTVTKDWEARSRRPTLLTPQMTQYLASRRDRALEASCLALCPEPRTDAIVAEGS